MWPVDSRETVCPDGSLSRLLIDPLASYVSHLSVCLARGGGIIIAHARLSFSATSRWPLPPSPAPLSLAPQVSTGTRVSLSSLTEFSRAVAFTNLPPIWYQYRILSIIATQNQDEQLWLLLLSLLGRSNSMLAKQLYMLAGTVPSLMHSLLKAKSNIILLAVRCCFRMSTSAGAKGSMV